MKKNVAILIVLLSILVQNTEAQNRSEEPSKKSITGLCLSGGGALGYAHIGALQALDEAGITVDHIYLYVV